MRVRRDKRARLLDEGREPYPVGVPRSHTLTQVRDAYAHLKTAEETQDVVGVVGRVVFIRNTGKLAFATLQEGDGTRLQALLAWRRLASSLWWRGKPMWTWATSSSCTAG